MTMTEPQNPWDVADRVALTGGSGGTWMPQKNPDHPVELTLLVSEAKPHDIKFGDPGMEETDTVFSVKGTTREGDDWYVSFIGGVLGREASLYGLTYPEGSGFKRKWQPVDPIPGWVVGSLLKIKYLGLRDRKAGGQQYHLYAFRWIVNEDGTWKELPRPDDREQNGDLAPAPATSGSQMSAGPSLEERKQALLDKLRALPADKSAAIKDLFKTAHEQSIEAGGSGLPGAVNIEHPAHLQAWERMYNQVTAAPDPLADPF